MLRSLNIERICAASSFLVVSINLRKAVLLVVVMPTP
jgi:hypothetical protein